MPPAPEQQEIHRSNSDSSSTSSPKDKLSPVEKATLDALTGTLASCNAHLGGSSIGKGFRLAARYHLKKRAPHSLSSLPANDSDDDDTSFIDPREVLEPGVHHTIEDPFYVIDLGIVGAQLARWRAAFPRVVPFYAIKCNPDPAIVRTLACLGCNFDCASRGEIALVQQISKELPKGYRKPEIIYANPCKSRSHIIDAVCRGVRMVTFDNTAEVRKCAAISKKIQLILRIITDDSGSQCRLSSKFGAPKQHWPILLAEAKQFGLEVVGVSFHVGSGCRDATRYEMALKDCKELFEMAKREYGFDMKILDIGGGFPGETHSLWNPAKAFGDPTAEERDLTAVPEHRRKMTELEPFPSIREELGEAESDDEDEEDDDDEKEGKELKEIEKAKEEDDDASTLGDNEREYMYFNEIAEAVCPMLDELFPPSSGVKIIAEPGRYLVAACATLVASIVSVRNNITDKSPAFGISDKTASENVFMVTRAEEDEIVEGHAAALEREENPIIETLVEELADYSQRFARANLAQQEIDVYLDNVNPEETDEVLAEAPEGAVAGESNVTSDGVEMTHTVEGMQAGIVVGCADMFDDDASAFSGRRSRGFSFDGSNTLDNSVITGTTNIGGLDIPCVLAAAGEAAVSGIVRQAIADSVQPLQDDFAYYINDGVYGAFNNLLFDHATVRPRKLRDAISPHHSVVEVVHGEGENALRTIEVVEEEADHPHDENLYSSTVFGPTCDSMDVLSRGVLLPKMNIGDWMYFQNMGAYTSAAASTFNGFPTTDKFYVCSVKPQHFTRLVTKGRVDVDLSDEKKEER
ncbi:ornithine decarboxylase [Skeletonema marinoi]|uniref:ornithine decarboxylase n=1 Tax=Skeletonema marinoi TaxID=267567 RepID=A0AAD8YHP5_9STRA|nr:ornithine decarboxylase [Skeletonema marinoi]